MPKPNFFKQARFYSVIIATWILNLNVFGFSLRSICSPGFNCHGCPWATCACPIGVFAFNSGIRQIPVLAVASILAIGVLLGRLVCAFACPFGLLQDLLYKIPGPKLSLPQFLRYLKYVALISLVFLFPYLLGFEQSGFVEIPKPKLDKNDDGGLDVAVYVKNISDKDVSGIKIDFTYVDQQTNKPALVKSVDFPDVTIPAGENQELPVIKVENRLSEANLLVTSPQSQVSQEPRYQLYFCKICPKGTLTASLPARLTGGTTEAVYAGGGWFSLRYIIAAAFVILMVVSSRPFCRLLCPLGAIYGACATTSLMTMEIDESTCNMCGACNRVCPVELDVPKELGGAECIACGDCKIACPQNSIHRKVRFKG